MKLKWLKDKKRVPFWFRTKRDAKAVDAEYSRVFALLMQSSIDHILRIKRSLGATRHGRAALEKFQASRKRKTLLGYERVWRATYY